MLQKARVSAYSDTGAADFAERTAALALEVLGQGSVSAVSCVGVGFGSMRWSEEELQRLELGVVGAFAHGCHDAGISQFCLLSVAGSTARSRFRYVRIMGMKEDTVRNIGFTRLAIFRPGIIVGNAHTPAWVNGSGSLDLASTVRTRPAVILSDGPEPRESAPATRPAHGPDSPVPPIIRAVSSLVVIQSLI